MAAEGGPALGKGGLTRLSQAQKPHPELQPKLDEGKEESPQFLCSRPCPLLSHPRTAGKPGWGEGQAGSRQGRPGVGAESGRGGVKTAQHCEGPRGRYCGL